MKLTFNVCHSAATCTISPSRSFPESLFVDGTVPTAIDPLQNLNTPRAWLVQTKHLWQVTLFILQPSLPSSQPLYTSPPPPLSPPENTYIKPLPPKQPFRHQSLISFVNLGQSAYGLFREPRCHSGLKARPCAPKGRADYLPVNSQGDCLFNSK